MRREDEIFHEALTIILNINTKYTRRNLQVNSQNAAAGLISVPTCDPDIRLPERGISVT